MAHGADHFGVLRAFVDAGVLPRVLTGTSAGGLMSAMACTHTDEELKTLLVPELAVKITAFSDSLAVWAQRLLRTGARFDSVDWARKVVFHPSFCTCLMILRPHSLPEARQHSKRPISVLAVS